MDKKNNSFPSPFLLITLILVLASNYLIFLVAPLEKIQGVPQKIFYFHLPSAITMFLAFVIVAIASAMFLWKEEREWDIYAYSSAELGLMYCFIVLLTGPIWAKPIWGAWWTWDGRLTFTLILALIYIAYLMLRANVANDITKAKFCAVLGIIGPFDIVLIHFSVKWFRSMHPNVVDPSQSGIKDPWMFRTLLLSLISFIFLYFLLFKERIALEKMSDEVDILKKERQS